MQNEDKSSLSFVNYECVDFDDLMKDFEGLRKL